MTNVQQLELELDINIKNNARLSDFSSPGWLPLVDAVRQLHLGLIRQIYIFGEQGTGKSHLLSAISESILEMGQSIICLSLSSLVSTNVDVLSDLESFDVIAIDDLQAIEDSIEWQKALFHLINRSNEQAKRLIFASSKPVNEIQFQLFDLITRLSQATSFKTPDGREIRDRQAITESILQRYGWQFDQRIIQHLLQEGPHRTADIIYILTHLQSMFATLPNKRISKSSVKDAINLIDEQTLLTELETI